MKRDGFEPSEYSKLCERHFEKDQFAINPDVAYNVKFHLKSKMLKPGAVPSVFDYTDPKKKKPESSLSVSPVTGTCVSMASGRRSTALEKIAKKRRFSVRYYLYLYDIIYNNF